MTDDVRLLAAVTLTRERTRTTGTPPFFAASFAPLFDLDRKRAVAELAARAENGCKQARVTLAAGRPEPTDAQ